MVDLLRVSTRLSIPVSELKLTFTRSSGPGGQHVNTSDTRVVVSFDVTRSPSLPDFLRERVQERIGNQLVDGTLTVDSQRFRSQDRNRHDAFDKLRKILADATEPPLPQRRATKPTRSSQRRRVEAKKHRGEIKRGRRSNGDD